MQITYNEHFLAPDLQALDLRVANLRHDLGLGEEEFARLGPPPPWPEGRLKAVVLVARLPACYGKSGLERTVEEYWRRLAWPVIGMGGRMARMPDLRFDADHLVELGAGVWQPGLSWAVLDLAASWSRAHAHSPQYGSLMALSGKARPAGIEVLAAAAMHPRWLLAMDGNTVPFTWLPGLLLKIDGVDHKVLPYTPALSLLRQGQDVAVTLTASPSHFGHLSFAVPRCH